MLTKYTFQVLADTSTQAHAFDWLLDKLTKHKPTPTPTPTSTPTPTATPTPTPTPTPTAVPSDPPIPPSEGETTPTSVTLTWDLPPDQGDPPAAYGCKCVDQGQPPTSPEQGVSTPPEVNSTSGVVTDLQPGGSYTCARENGTGFKGFRGYQGRGPVGSLRSWAPSRMQPCHSGQTFQLAADPLTFHPH